MSISFTPGSQYYPKFSRPQLSTSIVESTDVCVKVYPLFLQESIVEWSIPTSWGDCTYNVYRSPYDEAEFKKVNSNVLTGTFFFRDTSVLDVSKYHNHEYVVEVKLPSGAYLKSKPTTWENKRSNWVEIRAKEIKRREDLLLRKWAGVDSFIFRKITFGKRCTLCWNPVIEKVTRDNCPECLGTSFEGGYFPGFRTKIQYDPSPNNAKLGPVGVTEFNQLTAWTTSLPVLHVFDLVLRIPDFALYRIESLNPTELQSVTVRQMMNLVELDKNSIEFLLAKKALPLEFQQ